MATTRNDKLMYVVLVAAIVAGLATTLLGAAGGEEHNYRLTVSPWFRSLFVLQPDVAAMSRAGLAFQLHAAHRHGAVRALAVHPARARLHRAGAVPVPALHRVPLPRGGHGRTPTATRLGGGRSGGVATAVTAARRLPERCAQRGGPARCATPAPRGAWPAADSRRPPVHGHRGGQDRPALGGARRHQRQCLARGSRRRAPPRGRTGPRRRHGSRRRRSARAALAGARRADHQRAGRSCSPSGLWVSTTHRDDQSLPRSQTTLIGQWGPAPGWRS